jgi:acyl carrier protein phosphodiesterase
LNFLAHIYLSFGDDALSIGNFIADHIRGKKYLHYPEPVQKGILLHRAIDTFTDTHPITRKSSKRLHSRYSHYSRVIVDIYYDHFLANNWQAYSEKSLRAFTEEFYGVLQGHYEILPEGVQRFMPYMIADNWLLSYAQTEGIAQVLQGMNRRTRFKSGMDRAIEELHEHYDAFQLEFQQFFEELIIFSRQKIETL